MDWKNDEFSRRKFLKGMGAVFLGAMGVYSFLPYLQERAVTGYGELEKEQMRQLRQIITADSAHSRTVAWQSDFDAKDTVLEYRRKGVEELEAIAAVSTRFADGTASSYLHTALLTALSAGREYEYRVGYGNKRSGWKQLATDGGGQFKAILFPDSQSSDYSGWRRVAQAAGKANPDAKFFVNMGDLVDNGEDAAQWREWFNSLHGMIEEIPCAPVMGNHEAYDLNWKVRMPKAFLQLFPLPPNGNEAFLNQYYSFDYGDVHFSVLNTQLEEMLPFQPDLLTVQTKWLAQDLAATTKKWKIVLMHKDILTYEIKGRTGRHAGISDVGTAFMPLFDQYNVDVVLTAHLHTYRRRKRLRNFRTDSRGSLYIVTGVAGDVRYPDFWVTHPLDDFVAPQPETENYMTLEASADSLRLSCYSLSGEQIDTIEVVK